ncbi:MAG: hypothetical protein AB1480_15505 [Nitrospirota bacterium]
MNWEYLISLDIGSIHNYIFGTNRLREIRGASSLLNKLNSEIPLNEIKSGKYGNENKDWRYLIAGGGNIKVLFSDESKAEEYKNFLTESFRKEAPGTKIAIILSKRNGESEQQWLKRSEKELQIAKYARHEKGQIVTNGFFKVCQACGLYPAEYEDLRPEGMRYICKTCDLKVNESRNYVTTELYKRLTKEIGFTPEFPSEFNEIGQVSDPEGYIGFIYADGNRMGEYLANKINSFDALASFSNDIKEATFDATVTAIKTHFGDKFIPIQMILSGGDDLILALPAHKAMDIAIDFCEEFNSRLKSRGISTSASIVICHDSLPIKNVLNAADSLLKNAKAESRKKDGGSFIDFIVVTGSALEDPVSKRKRELERNDIGTHNITKRPYSIDDFKKLIDAIREFQLSDFPNNKLKALYTYLFKGHYQSILDACYIKTRLKDEHKGLINKFGLTMFPWEEVSTLKYTTPFGDIVELYEFIH